MYFTIGRRAPLPNLLPLSREEYISTTIFSEEKDGMPGGRGRGKGGNLQ